MLYLAHCAAGVPGFPLPKCSTGDRPCMLEWKWFLARFSLEEANKHTSALTVTVTITRLFLRKLSCKQEARDVQANLLWSGATGLTREELEKQQHRFPRYFYVALKKEQSPELLIWSSDFWFLLIHIMKNVYLGTGKIFLLVLRQFYFFPSYFWLSLEIFAWKCSKNIFTKCVCFPHTFLLCFFLLPFAAKKQFSAQICIVWKLKKIEYF